MTNNQYLQIIQQITNLFNQKQLNELELIFNLEDQTIKVNLKRNIEQKIIQEKITSIEDNIEEESYVQEESYDQEEIQQEAIQSEPVKTILNENEKIVKAPLSGNFYLYPFPGADPFIEEGQEVKKGDTICIIESMKVLNEIESPYSGKVKKILVENSKFVKEGDPIIVIETS